MTCCLLIHWPTLRNGEEPVHDIQVICAEWNDKMKKYEEKRYSEKEALNICTEEQKLADIEFLKKQNPPGLFTRSNEVSWAVIVITMMLSTISSFTLKSDWLKGCH